MILRSAPALIAVAALSAFALTTFAQPPKEWGIHDMNRPQPKVIDPGTHIMPAASCWSAIAEMPPGRLASCA